MMRKKHNELMQGNKQKTGKWNYDGENRKKLPKEHKPTPPLVFNNDVSKIVAEINKTNIKTIGTIDAKNFVWPVNRKQSLKYLTKFLPPNVYRFSEVMEEIAMTPNKWSLYHTRALFFDEL